MNKYAAEVIAIGGKELLDAVNKEFKDFFIVGRDQDFVVLGDGSKNVRFNRATKKAVERFVFDKARRLERKR